MISLAMVLAGGLGTRLRSLTHDAFPKPMMPVKYKGEEYPFLEFLLSYLKSEGVERVMLCIGHKGDVIIRHFGDGIRYGIEINYDDDGDAYTAARVIHALSQIEDDVFFVLCGDVFHPISLSSFTEDFKNHPQWLIELSAENNLLGLTANLATDETGMVTDYSRSHPVGKCLAVETGILAVRRKALNSLRHQPELALTENIYPSLIEEQALGAYFVDAPFFDIGTPQGFHRFQSFVDRNDVKPISLFH